MELHLINDITEINRRLCCDIWNLTNTEETPNGLSPRLLLPSVASKSRISEQEARVLYMSILNMTNYFYSIETPTEKSYQLTGNSPVRARSDLSLHYLNENNLFTHAANVEFKAHNPEINKINKDIEKLIRENKTGNWFHLLKNVDSKTMPNLFNKFIKSLETNHLHIKEPISIVFCFCVLEKHWACIKHYYYNPNEHVDFNQYNQNFFQLNYSISDKKIMINDNHQWSIVD